MEEKIFVINDNTKPDFETEMAKWYLCIKGEKYLIWRVDLRNGFKSFVIQRKSDGAIVAEDHTIEGIGYKHDILEKFY